jgi:DNA-binding MarR family transcriptional regulator
LLSSSVGASLDLGVGDVATLVATYLDEPTRQFRDALRLLFILANASEPAGDPPPEPGAVRAIWSQKRLQKMDFWMRNPDHLAHALLDEYEASADARWLKHAKAILHSDEPELRRDAMAKYLWGAYEPIDTGLAPLISYGLAVSRRHPANRRRTYFLLAKGAELAGRMTREMAEAAWYADRAGLVGQLCAGRSGEDLARMQYENPEYANAPNGETIGSIADQVRARLANLEGAR